MSDKEFAPDYERDSQDRVLFPRDTSLRDLLFPFSDSTIHIAKQNMLMVREQVKFVSEVGETILDPFAGTGTILVALTVGRNVMMIELEEPFQKAIEQNIKGIGRTVPDADSMVMLIPGDSTKILPLPVGIFQHTVFSPPYPMGLKKKGEMDKTSVDLGYDSATEYSANPENLTNLNSFFYHQKMEVFYRKCLQSLPEGGTMTVIIKDRMEQGKRMMQADRTERDCLRLGFELVARNKWFARGGGYSAINRAAGLETVDEEDLITLRKPLPETNYYHAAEEWIKEAVPYAKEASCYAKSY